MVRRRIGEVGSARLPQLRTPFLSVCPRSSWKMRFTVSVAKPPALAVRSFLLGSLMAWRSSGKGTLVLIDQIHAFFIYIVGSSFLWKGDGSHEAGASKDHGFDHVCACVYQ